MRHLLLAVIRQLGIRLPGDTSRLGGTSSKAMEAATRVVE
jgi:hypothetical protein